MAELTSIGKSNIVLAAIMIIILIAISGMLYKPKLEQTTMVVSQPQLIKNNIISFSDGDIYEYVYNSSAGEQNFTFLAREFPDCMIIGIVQFPEQSICIDQFGLENGSDIYQSQNIFLFKSWMLALYEKWEWKSTMTLQSATSEQLVSAYSYKVVGKDRYKGRDVFIVEEKTDDFMQKEWVDTERRILIKAEGSGYSIELTKTNAFNLSN